MTVVCAASCPPLHLLNMLIVLFLGETNVRRLGLENIVQFNKCEVLVYMDEMKKPAVGQGLNKAAEVTLLNVKYVDKKTGQHHAEGPEVEKFEKRLRKKTEEQGVVFLGFCCGWLLFRDFSY